MKPSKFKNIKGIKILSLNVKDTVLFRSNKVKDICIINDWLLLASKKDKNFISKAQHEKELKEQLILWKEDCNRAYKEIREENKRLKKKIWDVNILIKNLTKRIPQVKEELKDIEGTVFPFVVEEFKAIGLDLNNKVIVELKRENRCLEKKLEDYKAKVEDLINNKIKKVEVRTQREQTKKCIIYCLENLKQKIKEQGR